MVAGTPDFTWRFDMWARTFERAARLGLALSLAACAADDAGTAPRRVPRRPSLVTAAVVTVTNTNDAGPGSLREAIANAVSGSTIQFDPSIAGQTIVLTSGQLVVEQAELTIEGPATAGMIINGNSESAVFFVGNGATTRTTFRNLTLTNGQAEGGGGAIRSSGRNLTLDHVLVTGNRAVTSGVSEGHGGAISTSGVLSVVNSTISGNSADVDGGGIDGSAGSSIIIVNSTIVGNSAATGGGISSDGPVQLRNSIVAGNSAT